MAALALWLGSGGGNGGGGSGNVADDSISDGGMAAVVAMVPVSTMMTAV